MAESSPNGQKTLLGKEKLLVTSNFSFSHSVFKKLVLQTRKSQGLFAKGLRCKVRSKLASLDNVDSDQTVQVRHCDTAGIFPEKEIAIVGSQHLE